MIIKKHYFFSEHKYMFTFFFLALFSMFIGSGDSIISGTAYSHSFHIVDFRLGFISKVLPGAIFQLFFKDPTIEAMAIYETSLLIVVVLLSSYLIEQLYYSAEEKYRNVYLYVISIFFVSGCTFRIYYREPGMLDVYWIYALLLFMFLIKSKKTWFLIPIPFVFMVAVHFASLFCYIPLMALLLLYKASRITEKKEKAYLLIVFASSIVLTIVFLVIFMYNERNNLKLSIDELHTLLKSKNNYYFFYYDYALYSKYYLDYSYLEKILHVEYFPIITSTVIPNILRDIINRFLWQIYVNFYLYKETVYLNKLFPVMGVALFSACMPIMVLFYKCFIKAFKTAENKLKRFSVFCMIALFPFTIVTSLLLSVDMARWVNHAFTCCFICFFFLLAKEKETISSILYSSFAKIKSVWLIMYFLIVLAVGFHPCT